jgi:protease I
MRKPKVLILTGDAAESLEVLYPYQRLIEEGYEVHIAAPSKKKLHFVVHDFEPGYDTFTEKPGYSWDADLAFAYVNPADYVALVIPGGRAPEYIRNNTDFQRILRHFFEREKPVAHLCHAALALTVAGVLKGRRTTALRHNDFRKRAEPCSLLHTVSQALRVARRTPGYTAERPGVG